MQLWKKVGTMALALLMIVSILTIYTSADYAEEPIEDAIATDAVVAAPDVNAASALLMEEKTGTVLFEKNSTEALPPASVTKIMTLLLVMEALDSGAIRSEDAVNISAYASSMGGSQVFLAEGEKMTVEELLKCTVIASANDAAVALAEHLGGSEEAFVAQMNTRAAELGAETAHFENATGLDDEAVNHIMSAKDIALISRELISHRKILEYSSVWMDTIRDGQFTLTNTNRLIRFYDGATGLKTGSTDKAKFCISATAERNGMSLIAVIMGAPSRDIRNVCAKSLFDWGFANYGLYEDSSADCGTIPVLRGMTDAASTRSTPFYVVLPKSKISKVVRSVSMQPSLEAPVAEGICVGTVTYAVGEEIVGTAEILANENVERITFLQLVVKMVKIFILS